MRELTMSEMESIGGADGFTDGATIVGAAATMGTVGAQGGAAIGTLIAPGPGTFIGGFAGGMGGLFIGTFAGIYYVIYS